MANYIDPLANAELQRTLAFARAREAYPGLRGELLLEICEAAWERSAGDPSDGGALVRFENALDLIARQYRIGGGRLSVSEVAQTAIPATALNPYMRAGAKRIAEDARAAENAAAVPVNPTFGDRLSRVPRLAPAPIGIGLAASVFGVAAAAQAGVLPDTPITPSHHTSVQADSGASNGSAKKSGGNPAPIAPAATSPGPDSFLAASHAASQAAPGEWQATTDEGSGATNAVPTRSAVASPGAVDAPASVEAAPVATAVPTGGTAAPVSYSAEPVAQAPEPVQAETPPAPKPAHPSITIDLNGGGVQVNRGDDNDQAPDQDQQQDGKDEGQPTGGDEQKPPPLYGVVMVTDPATGQTRPAVTLNGVVQAVDGIADGVTGDDQDDDQTEQPGTDDSTQPGTDDPAQSTTDDSPPPTEEAGVGVDDETTDDGSTTPVGDSDGDEDTGDATNEEPPPDDGTNEEQGNPVPDPAAVTQAVAPATPAPATPAPATPVPATPAPATPAPATPAPATPAPATPAPATPAPATPAAATPAPAAPTTPAAATTPAATPTPGA